MDKEKLGKFLEERRKKKLLSREELAGLLEIPWFMVTRWETGLSMPDESLYQKLCNILDISINDFLSGEIVSEKKYKQIADKNFVKVINSHVYSLQERLEYYSKMWNKDHLPALITTGIIWLILLLITNHFKQSLNFLIFILGYIILIIIYFSKKLYLQNYAYGNKEDYKVKNYFDAIRQLREIKDLLNKFEDKDKAIIYLSKEFKKPKKDCEIIYNFIMSLNFKKIDKKK